MCSHHCFCMAPIFTGRRYFFTRLSNDIMQGFIFSWKSQTAKIDAITKTKHCWGVLATKYEGETFPKLIAQIVDQWNLLRFQPHISPVEPLEGKIMQWDNKSRLGEKKKSKMQPEISHFHGCEEERSVIFSHWPLKFLQCSYTIKPRPDSTSLRTLFADRAWPCV